MATCVEAGGATYPNSFAGHGIKPSPGQSLMPLLRDPTRRRERNLFCEHETHAAIRQGNWKLVTLAPEVEQSAWLSHRPNKQNLGKAGRLEKAGLTRTYQGAWCPFTHCPRESKQ